MEGEKIPSYSLLIPCVPFRVLPSFCVATPAARQTPKYLYASTFMMAGSYNNPIRPYNSGNSSRNHSLSNGGEVGRSYSDGLAINVAGLAPTPGPMTADESDERDTLISNEEPRRGVKRELGTWQIFVRTNVFNESALLMSVHSLL